MLPWSIPHFWKCNINTKDIEKMIPPTIWKDIWKAWPKYAHMVLQDKQEILMQTLWYNSHIKVQRSPLPHNFLGNRQINEVLLPLLGSA